MPMQGIIEGIADDVLRKQSRNESPRDLVRRVVGMGQRSALKIVPRRSIRGDGALIKIHGLWTVCLASDLSPSRFRWVATHEVGEWLLRDVQAQNVEDLANRLAAAILAPKRLVVHAKAPADVYLLARECGVSETCAWLRVGEVVRPTAVISPMRVYSRGLSGSELRGPGLARGRINDAPGRQWVACA